MLGLIISARAGMEQPTPPTSKPSGPKTSTVA